MYGHPGPLDEIIHQIGLFEKEYRRVSRLKLDQQYHWIEYPKFPGKLSEALAWHLIRLNLVISEEFWRDIRPGKRRADIEIKIDSKWKKIEIKASTGNAIASYTEKDVKADYLIWIDFKNYFKSIRKGTARKLAEEKVFHVFAVAGFSKYRQKAGNLVKLERLIERVKKKVEISVIGFESGEVWGCILNNKWVNFCNQPKKWKPKQYSTILKEIFHC